MSELAKKDCVPCRGGVPPLDAKQSTPLLKQLDGWTLEQGHLTKTFKFPDFAKALAFVNRVGAMAEKQGHHPDIYLAWGMARVEIWTHKINGLTESDFIFAAKTDGCL
jgi:4a-hydroxytetrahydrobiopterin dehydratase